MNRESVQSVLTRQGSLSFPANTPYIKDLAAAGGRAVRTSSGHLLFYGPDGRRFLATDPEGHPLHECEWQNGTLTRARLHLEWDAWVGIVPSGLINTTALDLSRKPGWERLTAEDLRRMAAGAMQVSIDEVRFFYRDDDLIIDRAGRAAIRQRKDAFYVLDDGTFDNGARVRFMSCMGAMHWDAIDFLPVVELFQSLLPGTGSAAFELIRGLYDDQQQGSEPRPLRYRGIPTYPSEGAYRLFSNFFVPHVAAGGDPLGVFMDPPRSHEVTWLPSPDPPRRYFNPSRKLCVTIKGDAVQKVTFADDTAGLPYSASAKAPGGRRVAVKGGRLLLEDANTRMEMEASPLWGALRDVPLRGPAALPDWRDLFDGGLPEIAPQEAYGAVLLYPEDDAEIGEIESHPFAAGYLEDLFEHDATFRRSVTRAQSVLIESFDGAVSACLPDDRQRAVRIRYRHAALAQHQAQLIWGRLIAAGHQEWLPGIRFEHATESSNNHQLFDVIYQCLPFGDFTNHKKLQSGLNDLARRTTAGALACVVGPEAVGHEPLPLWQIAWSGLVADLPPFQAHRAILPHARLKAGLTLFLLHRR